MMLVAKTIDHLNMVTNIIKLNPLVIQFDPFLKTAE